MFDPQCLLAPKILLSSTLLNLKWLDALCKFASARLAWASCRMRFRRKYLEVQQDLALAVVSDKHLATAPSEHASTGKANSSSSLPHNREHSRKMVAAFTTPDDAVRFLSFIYAMSKAVDKATLLARMLVTDDWMLCSRLDRNIQQRLLWVGIRPKRLKKQQAAAHDKPA